IRVPLLPGSLPASDLQRFKADFFKALAHPIRIRLLEVLRVRERSVQELQAALGLDQSTVSQQLAILRAKHVVVARKEGTTVRYAVRDPLVGNLLDVARRIFNNQLAGTRTMLRELQREARRPAHAQHGRAAASDVGSDPRSQVRGRRRRLRAGRRHFWWVVRRRGRRQQRRPGRRRHRGLPTITGGAPGRSARGDWPAAMTILTYVLATVVGLAAGFAGVGGMLGVGMSWRLPALLPLGGVSLVLDPLAGVFLAMIGFAAVPASLYALGDPRQARRGRGAYLLFVGAMAVVPLAGNALTFLLAWEL